MKFAVFGGDGRIVRLVRLLREDGHTVSTFALDKAVSGGSAAEKKGLQVIFFVKTENFIEYLRYFFKKIHPPPCTKIKK
ncbi:MAG: hypothetical protein IKV47_00290, partial [Oscillospiraceae bacterium]|nr:hypothetical protein [Oscillospiraceae bacterium]